MSDDKENPQKAARRLIAEANRTLAKLQSERMRTMSVRCLDAYEELRDPLHAVEGRASFAVDASLMKFLVGALNEDDFAESTKADELDQAAESFAVQLRLYRKHLLREFDVFFCYNSEHLGEVKSLAAQLRRRGLLPWMDQSELRPGSTWQAEIQRDIKSVKSCAVVIGSSGVGPWQQREIDAAIQLFVDRRLPVIPVILPTCKEVPELPLFLRAFSWVDFRTLDPDPTEQLILAVSGRRTAF